MSSRKDLKKTINSSMDLLYTDCILYSIASKDPKLEKVEPILTDIEKIQDDLLSRISNTEGKELKGRTKAFYNKIKEDLKYEIDRIGKEIQNLN